MTFFQIWKYHEWFLVDFSVLITKNHSSRKNCLTRQNFKKIADKYAKSVIFNVFASVISFNKDVIQVLRA